MNQLKHPSFMFGDLNNVDRLELTDFVIVPVPKEAQCAEEIYLAVVKAIIEKYPKTEQRFKDISIQDDAFWFTPDYIKDVHEIFNGLDIVLTGYDAASHDAKKYMNTLVRVGFHTGDVSSTFYHIHFIKEWWRHSHDTFCSSEKILLGHEIFELPLNSRFY